VRGRGKPSLDQGAALRAASNASRAMMQAASERLEQRDAYGKLDAEVPPATKDLAMDLASAIDDRQVISFTYDGLPRVVQPATYGQTTTGKLTLRGCQVDGRSHRNRVPCWELYTVSKIAGLSPAGEAFESFAVAGYTGGDSAFKMIIAQH